METAILLSLLQLGVNNKQQEIQSMQRIEMIPHTHTHTQPPISLCERERFQLDCDSSLFYRHTHTHTKGIYNGFAI